MAKGLIVSAFSARPKTYLVFDHTPDVALAQPPSGSGFNLGLAGRDSRPY